MSESTPLGPDLSTNKTNQTREAEITAQHEPGRAQATVRESRADVNGVWGGAPAAGGQRGLGRQPQPPEASGVWGGSPSGVRGGAPREKIGDFRA